MTTLMRTVETVDWEDPRHVPCETRTRAFGWDPIRGLHQGQQPQRLHRKAEYMAAPDPLVEMPDFPLAPRAPSIHGTKRPREKSPFRSLLGVKPTLPCGIRNVANDPSRTLAAAIDTLDSQP